jgi:glycerol uptake facilitator-like aquaporin|tara:strand:+ start:28 stop:315 length:288 start_codon:yes stop_codon:yes gene_type:complete
MLNYFVEFVGTFFFLSVIMVASKSNIKWAFLPIGLALAMVIFWGGSISGGHFNPAVSVMFLINGELSVMDTIVYILSQIVGGILALVYYHNYALI